MSGSGSVRMMRYCYVSEPLFDYCLVTKWGSVFSLLSFSTIGLLNKRKMALKKRRSILFLHYYDKRCQKAWTTYTTNSTFPLVLHSPPSISNQMLFHIHHNHHPFNPLHLPFVFCSHSSHDAISSSLCFLLSYLLWLQAELHHS